MRTLAAVLLLAVAAASHGDELEPAVSTSSAAITPATASSAKSAPKRAPVAAAPVAPAKAPAGARSAAHDQIDLGATQVTGNRELPNVMYVVPWKRPDLGEFAGRPPKSLLDELLAPVDREVFRRQNRYFAALHPDAAAAPAAPAMTPAAGAATTLPVGDEK